MSELPRYVLGLDPGKKSGISIFDLLFETYAGIEVDFATYGHQLEKSIEELKPAVVSEAFVINARTVKSPQASYSLEGIGIARYLARKYDCPFVVQPQSSAKRFASDERLKELGWYLKGKGHANDSARQVLLRIVNAGWWHSALAVGLTPPSSGDTIDSDGPTDGSNVISMAGRR